MRTSYCTLIQRQARSDQLDLKNLKGILTFHIHESRPFLANSNYYFVFFTLPARNTQSSSNHMANELCATCQNLSPVDHRGETVAMAAYTKTAWVSVEIQWRMAVNSARFFGILLALVVNNTPRSRKILLYLQHFMRGVLICPIISLKISPVRKSFFSGFSDLVDNGISLLNPWVAIRKGSSGVCIVKGS